jgi:hypothetical protein
MFHASITIRPVIGGFVVQYPTFADGATEPQYVEEIATTSGKALRIAKAAVEAFSLVTKTKDEAAE